MKSLIRSEREIQSSRASRLCADPSVVSILEDVGAEVRSQPIHRYTLVVLAATRSYARQSSVG